MNGFEGQPRTSHDESGSTELEGAAPARPPGDVTLLLENAGAGSDSARQRLLEVVYDELRIIASSHMRAERPNHTLGATDLVNESYLRLFRASGGTIAKPQVFAHRHASYKAAATAMRRILIDHARARAATKRGPSERGRISLDVLEASTTADPHDLLSLDAALSRFEAEDERAAAVVRLRFFGGRRLEEVAELLSVNIRTVKRDWEFARARLQQLLEEPDA
jgi:RNA polymerase sigma-70 factor, ECF subfamily